LEQEFLAALIWFPDFVMRAQQTYPFARDGTQATEIAWLAIALSERPEDQSRRRAMLQRLGPLGVIDAGVLELFTRHIITAGIGDKVRDGSRRLTGVHPEHGRRFEPDPALLDRVSGHDRFLNQLTDGSGRIILDLRIEEVEPAHDRGTKPELSDHSATIEASSSTQARTPPKPRPGPRPGQIDTVRQQRHKLIRQLRRMQRGRHRGERNSQTLDRFLETHKADKLPGGGSDAHRRDQLLREWGKLVRKEKADL
jgi:hypothetical protein